MALTRQARLAVETERRARAEPGVPRDPGFDPAGFATTADVTAAIATAEAYADAKVIDSIADADTTHAPSRNAIHDALALKAPIAAPTFTGNVTISLSAAGGLLITRAAGTVADVRWQTAGVDRWLGRVNGDSESGADAGSKFEFQARADDGSLIGIVYDVTRSTRVLDFKVAPTVNGAAIGGGSTPTGTGFRHVTAGVEDGAAKLVDTADINNDQVTNAKLANMAAHTIKANITGGSTDPVDSSLSAILDAEIGSTRGQLLVRGSALWQALSLGASGQAVISDGTDALWGSVGAAAGGGYTRLGSSTVAGSAATTITVSGLNLSAYKAFKVYFALKDAAASGTGTISLYYNSDVTATDYNEQSLTLNGTSLTAARANDARMGNLDASRYTTGFIEIEIDVNARASALIFSNRDNSSGIVWQSAMHVWTTNFANVTGITISSSIANQFAIGSTFIVYGITA